LLSTVDLWDEMSKPRRIMALTPFSDAGDPWGSYLSEVPPDKTATPRDASPSGESAQPSFFASHRRAIASAIGLRHVLLVHTNRSVASGYSPPERAMGRFVAHRRLLVP
jgi:hypothetical protein